jgi:hypothetical protein
MVTPQGSKKLLKKASRCLERALVSVFTEITPLYDNFLKNTSPENRKANSKRLHQTFT